MVRTNTSGSRAVDVDAVSAFDVAGKAVLLHTGGDRDFGTPAYAEDAPFVTAAATKWLVAHDAALVDIDSVNIDDLVDPTRAHPPARRRDPSRRAPHRAQPASDARGPVHSGTSSVHRVRHVPGASVRHRRRLTHGRGRARAASNRPV